VKNADLVIVDMSLKCERGIYSTEWFGLY